MNDRNVRQNRIPPRVIAFGDFELRLDTHELTKADVRVRLPPQPFQILRTLLDEPGSVITRDELCRAVWSPNTHVDFEAGLNTAVNRLRTILGDSADHPMFIETVSRIGYRFIAPVRSLAPVLTIGSTGRDNVEAKEVNVIRPSPAGKRGTIDRLRNAFRSAVTVLLRAIRYRAA